MSYDRRTLLRAGLATALLPLAAAVEPPHDVSFAQDFDELWTTLRDRYCYFDEKRTDWNRVRARYRPLAVTAPSSDAFAEMVRQLLAELYDAHTHLAAPLDGMPRWPLYDLKGERDGNAIRIVAIADDSAASRAGLHIGDRVLMIADRPAAEQVRSLLPRCLTGPDSAADAFAIDTALAGRRAQPRRFIVSSGTAAPRVVALPLAQSPPQPDVEWRRLAGGIGYIVIRSFGDDAVATTFDAALLALRDAPGLILDVRDNGGGDTAVARPIMGRFIAERKAYAMMRRRQGTGLSAPWTEYVDPKGPFTYTRPVVVLTSHWSGSMAEGFPMGMRDIGRATIVGTPMMGLGAAVFPIRLDRTGLQAQYSGEPVYDTHGRARSRLRPDVLVADGGDILAAGVAELRRQLA